MKFDFVIDTGASVSILPSRLASGLVINPTPVLLSAANQSRIAVEGETMLTFSIDRLRRQFTWNFVVADVQEPLLGKDFLSFHNLLVDCKNHQILDQLTSRTTGSKSLEITRSSNEVLINKVSHENPVVSELFAKYPQVLIPRNIDEVPTKTKSYHSIDTSNSCPTFCKNRRLSPEKEDAARKEFTSYLLLESYALLSLHGRPLST